MTAGGHGAFVAGFCASYVFHCTTTSDGRAEALPSPGRKENGDSQKLSDSHELCYDLSRPHAS